VFRGKLNSCRKEDRNEGKTERKDYEGWEKIRKAKIQKEVGRER
jgi:hypothetical protein